MGLQDDRASYNEVGSKEVQGHGMLFQISGEGINDRTNEFETRLVIKKC